MNYILPIFAGLVLLLASAASGQNPPQLATATPAATPTASEGNVAAPAATPASVASQYMARAVWSIEQYDAISAKIRYRVDSLGHAMVGAGTYAQQGRGVQRMFRLELKMQVGDAVRTNEQVNDGRYLWQFQDLEDPPTLTRLDFRRVRQTMERSTTITHPISEASRLISLGGLPKLLQGLNDSFDFVSAQEGQLDTLPVVILEGRWKAARLAALLPGQAAEIGAGKPAKLNKLPAHQPDSVLICLGRDDLFPYRLEFKRQTSSGAGEGSARGEAKTLLALEWYEVKVNTPVDARQFLYQPGGVQPTDVTDTFLRAMGLLPTASTTEK